MSYQGRARVLETQQRYAEALALLRQGLALAPAESLPLRDEKHLVGLLSARIDRLYRQGDDLYGRGELHSARSRFEELTELSPEHRDAQEFKQKIDAELQQQAQRAVGAGEAALGHAELLEAQRAFQQELRAWPAEISAKDGLDRSPAAALEAELAQVEEELRHRQEAIARLVRTAIRQQHFNKAGQLLAQAERLGSDLDDLADLKIEFNVAPVREVAHQLDMARQHVARGSFCSGLKAYRRALDIDPENVGALAGLKHGRSVLSEAIAQSLIEGAAAHRSGNLQQARLIYGSVLELDPHQQDALSALRQIEPVGRTGLTSADSKRIYLNGIELYAGGNYRQAIDAWRQVLALDPAHEKALMNINRAERKIRQIRERQGG